MKRTLTLAMLLSLSAASPLALGLGLGDTEVNSTLNAPLRASIPLTDSSGLPAERLKVSVAGERAFTAANLPRTSLAASVKTDVARRQGQWVLDLTTERVVREPWIDLLLRFDWPNGQQLREVTLLLDPPDYDQLPALVEGSSSASREVASSPSDSVSGSAPISRSVARASRAGPGETASVRSGDTLWSVAGRLRPDSDISMDQMMVALVEANPDVFPSGNINAMRAGFTLVVPSRDAITTRSAAEADRIVQAMNQAWANRGSGAPARVALGDDGDARAAGAVATAPSREVSAAPAAGEASSEATTRGALADEEANGEAEPRLTLLSDAQVAAEGVAPVDDGAPSRQEGAPSIESREGEATAAPTLGVMSPDEGEGPFIDPGVVATILGDGELTEDQRLLRLESRWRESRQALAAVRSERDELQSQIGDLRKELDAMRERLSALGAGGQGTDAPGGGGVEVPGSEVEQSRHEPWWGALYQGVIDRSLTLGGVGVALLLALWVLVRRRHREESEPAPVFNEMSAVNPSADGVVVPETARAQQEGDGGLPAEAPVRASMPEAEAINEADIFIAYGRYDQARELLESSLVGEPGRHDLRLKLLRVQLEQGDEAAAASQAEQLQDSDDPDVQAEVARLMEHHAHPAPSVRTPEPEPDTLADRAVFPEADVLPPRRFDVAEGGDDASGQEAPEGPAESPGREAPGEPSGREASAGPHPDPVAKEVSSRDTTPGETTSLDASLPQSERDAPSPNDALTDPLARYRPPELDAGSTDGQASAPVPPAASSAEQSGEVAEEPSHDPEQGSVLPEVPLETRQAEDGREIIDYRPPALEESPPSREETPLQPSVEFTPPGVAGDVAGDEGGSATGMSGIGAERDLPEEWDIEEVAFPPLSRDNGVSSAAASSASTLVEARRLLDAGEARQARAMLERLIDESDDPDARQEARELLDQSVQ
ncbi:MAG: FimV/HubP family polar landmark protein [Pseudomonadota bacterium]